MKKMLRHVPCGPFRAEKFARHDLGMCLGF